MTACVLPRPQYVAQVFDLVAELRNDHKIMEAVEQGMKARLEGRVKPWSKVKEELEIR